MRFHSDLLTSLDQAGGVGKDMDQPMGLEMLTRSAREAGSQTSYHGSHQGEEGRTGEVLAVSQSGSKGWLMRYRNEGMDVGEVVIDQQL